jgi:hypothetical protein
MKSRVLMISDRAGILCVVEAFHHGDPPRTAQALGPDRETRYRELTQ